jgi:hypothetical protein
MVIRPRRRGKKSEGFTPIPRAAYPTDALPVGGTAFRRLADTLDAAPSLKALCIPLKTPSAASGESLTVGTLYACGLVPSRLRRDRATWTVNTRFCACGHSPCKCRGRAADPDDVIVLCGCGGKCATTDGPMFRRTPLSPTAVWPTDSVRQPRRAAMFWRHIRVFSRWRSVYLLRKAEAELREWLRRRSSKSIRVAADRAHHPHVRVAYWRRRLRLPPPPALPPTHRPLPGGAAAHACGCRLPCLGRCRCRKGRRACSAACHGFRAVHPGGCGNPYGCVMHGVG